MFDGTVINRRIGLIYSIVLFFALVLFGLNSTAKESAVILKGEKRPYSQSSPWNLEIGPDPKYDELSDYLIENLAGPFGSNNKHFTIPIYVVDSQTPRQQIQISHYYSYVTGNGEKLDIKKHVTIAVPIPVEAAPANGTDGNIVLWDPDTGDEWGFWKAVQTSSHTWQAKNGYHYNTNWSAVPPSGFQSRGAGVPYFAGLVRPWEIKEGRISHAIAFGVNYPNKYLIFPATKSDGKTLLPYYLPMGARLQLDPSLSEKDFEIWGLDRAGKIIAKAMQKYGMILVSGSGHPKIYTEYDKTANWKDEIDKNTVRNIPYSAFHVLDRKTHEKPESPTNLTIEKRQTAITIHWQKVEWANRYIVKRKKLGEDSFVLLTDMQVNPEYVDTVMFLDKYYRYCVSAVNHNGISDEVCTKRVNLEQLSSK